MRVHASIEPLNWESDFFQLKSAKLHFDDSAATVSHADLDAYALVQAKIPAYRLGGPMRCRRWASGWSKAKWTWQ